MFVSIDDRADDKYESETRNFFKLKRDVSASKWQSILDEDNSKIFEIEMTQTLIDVNRFITKIEIDSNQLNQPDKMFDENEKRFKEYLAIGRELLTKLKLLATLEKASVMDKYEQSNVRKLSFVATSDTASCADTESVVEGHAAVFYKEGSVDRRDSRTITLVHKYAASFTSHYEMFDKLNHDVEEIVERFNEILDFIHHRIQQRTHHIIYDRGEQSELEMKTSDDPVDDEQRTEIYKSKQIGESDSTSAVQILTEHLCLSSLQPIFEHVCVTGSGHRMEYTYSCSIAGQYNCEGRSRKKSTAKEEAAAQMIKELIKRQKCEDLLPEIIPFTEIQIHDLSITLTEREDLIDKLEENCLHLHEPPPLYTVLSETGRSNEPYFAVKCEALGYIAVGHGSRKSQAKKNAAKSILNLLNVNKKESNVGKLHLE